MNGPPSWTLEVLILTTPLGIQGKLPLCCTFFFPPQRFLVLQSLRWAKLRAAGQRSTKGPYIFPCRASFDVGFVLRSTASFSYIAIMCAFISCVHLRNDEDCSAAAQMKVSTCERVQKVPIWTLFFFSLCLQHVGSFSCEGAALERNTEMGRTLAFHSPISFAKSLPKLQIYSAIHSQHFKPGCVSRDRCVILFTLLLSFILYKKNPIHTHTHTICETWFCSNSINLGHAFGLNSRMS